MDGRQWNSFLDIAALGYVLLNSALLPAVILPPPGVTLIDPLPPLKTGVAIWILRERFGLYAAASALADALVTPEAAFAMYQNMKRSGGFLPEIQLEWFSDANV